MIREFISGFAEDLNHMIDLRVALNFSESTYLDRAKAFDNFCAERYPNSTVVVESMVWTWLKGNGELNATELHRKAAFIRAFARYQKSIGKAAYVVPDAFTSGAKVFVPYMMTDREISDLFEKIDCYEKATRPLEGPLLSVYFRLTYTCGLRPKEGRNLKCNEVDLKTGEVRIVNTKWHKSRVVVMSEDMLSLARKYAVLRDAAFPESEYFFPSAGGGPYSATSIGQRFKRFYAQIHPETPPELLPSVRVYDLRHRFATAALNHWLDEKVDLSSRLPYLQTYMGHKDLNSTAYYIHLLPENLVKSAGIDWDSMNRLLPEVELWEE